MKRLLTGNITQVTRMSPCPVLAVTPPLPSQAWRLCRNYFGVRNSCGMRKHFAKRW